MCIFISKVQIKFKYKYVYKCNKKNGEKASVAYQESRIKKGKQRMEFEFKSKSILMRNKSKGHILTLHILHSPSLKFLHLQIVRSSVSWYLSKFDFSKVVIEPRQYKL